MRKICEAVFLFVGTLGWWGFVYPDLCPGVEAYEEETGREEAYEAGGWQARRDKTRGQGAFEQGTGQSSDARAWLFYTTPSPRERAKTRIPSSG